MPELRTSFTAPAGGVMTDEVGVITGDLELATTCENDHATVWIRYVGADEWYRLSQFDGPVTESEHDSWHRQLLSRLSRPR